ncbi:probable cytochrome P450 49a1 [Trichonephila clavipes]|uniref:Probable cytochrome P450 49a1 n=1 Tax=Trichonephila clavipes TaxID=2585209 RepID=A0A8X6SRF8_TRICX|nr:probable cytochrome P450 49a1 [Trichonephila clavipes]
MIRSVLRITEPCGTGILINIPRVVASQCNASSTSAMDEECLKPFSSIPAPPRWPIIGHLHLFRKRGPYAFERINDAYKDFYHRYGPVVRLDLGIKLLLLFNAEDIEKLFAPGNKYPQRPLFEALRHYRLKRKDLYSCGGLITENGEQWYHLRKAIQFIMHPSFPEIYFPLHEKVAEDFVQLINQKRDEHGLIPNFLQDIYRFAEEAIGIVCFGKRLGLISLDVGNDKEREFGEKLTQAADDALKSMADSLLGFPWWKIFPTPTYKKLVRSQSFFQSFAAKCIQEAELKLKDPEYQDDGKLELIKRLFENKNLKYPDISLLMTELFEAGFDTTGNSLGFLLYNLAKNPGAQENLYRDIMEHSSSGLKGNSIDNMKYLKACIQESHRLTPAVGGTARILQAPQVFSGYEVPAGVLCIGMQPVISRFEKYFSDPLDFKPERWLDATLTKYERKSNPYTVMPFSHGVRRCVGQRFAEQEMRLCIIKIIQNFRVEYDGPEVGTIMRLSLVPDKPLNFKFIPRRKTGRPGFDARCHQIPSECTRSTCSLIQWVRSLVGLFTSAGTGEYFPPLQFTC